MSAAAEAAGVRGGQGGAPHFGRFESVAEIEALQRDIGGRRFALGSRGGCILLVRCRSNLTQLFDTGRAFMTALELGECYWRKGPPTLASQHEHKVQRYRMVVVVVARSTASAQQLSGAHQVFAPWSHARLVVAAVDCWAASAVQ